MINIANKELNFNDLEENIWKEKMKEGIEKIQFFLRKIDKYILDNKDKNLFEPKDFQNTTIKCKFGEIPIQRRRYKYKMSDNTIKYVYLLDEYLELGYSGLYSQSIVEQVMKEVVEKSYRKVAETVMDNTNISISHNAARNIVLNVSEKKIKPFEEEKLKLYEQGIIEGQKEQGILFEESDGIFISSQKRNRKIKKTKTYDKEAKIAIIHEGFEPRYSNDFKLVNKQIVVTMDSSKKLKQLVDMTIGTKYKSYKIKKLVINSDGAGWCKDVAQGENEKHQLDMFHIQEKINRIISDEEYRKMMSGIVKTDKPEYIFNIIHNYKEELEFDQKQEELNEVKELEKYLRNNKQGLLRYQYELGYSNKELNEKYKNVYRNLGTEESQMYCVCRKRMKRNRTSWSKRGAEGILKIIAYVKNNEIKDLINGKLEKKLQSEVKSRNPQPKKVKKIKNTGKTRYCGKNTLIDNLELWNKEYIRELLKPKSFNEIRLIGD